VANVIKLRNTIENYESINESIFFVLMKLRFPHCVRKDNLQKQKKGLEKGGEAALFQSLLTSKWCHSERSEETPLNLG